MSLTIEIDHPDLLVGIVSASNVPMGPASAALAAEVDRAAANAAGREAALSGVRAAIRDLLRFGGYKPAGRGKPASEYLAQAAARGEFPRISHIVDALNLVSLESGLPISLLDADRALEGAGELTIRLGREGEAYVFNAAGHTIDIRGLVCAARADGPAIGNPVKDSMAAKTTPETRNTLAIVWASRRALDAENLKSVCGRLGEWISGTDSSFEVLGTARIAATPKKGLSTS
jgi:DNA/RNA-binding domain of Phe-tRNA-synthetase-like protein